MNGSKETSRAAAKMALTSGRDEENELKAHYLKNGIKTVAIDFGSDFANAVPKILERAVVQSAKIS